MCSACIERLYSMGPAPCPIPGCNQILRRANFYQQIFEDLTVEREIRVRQRLSRIFNKQQREFASLLDYNNYLEFVEDITFKLANSDKDAKDILLENAASSLRKSAASSSHTTQGRVSTGISGAGGYFNPLAKSTTSASAFASNSDDENVEVDPFLHCYNKPKYIDSIKPHYVDGNPAIKPAFSNNALAGGFSLNMHYRYLIEAAMSGIDLPPKSNALKK
ncbi:RNA polymerase II transcription factor B subunit 3 [Zancudomyces culisetae]|uniref:RNA polymerase II transcription factor B subunit 3 n=1 Tax=Zancudomyces culisetae TaxID=1213189 RepID=A0A1R1PLI0_ZANCU|nr:RNA polymerase II transcription factor B subunit 3 [Zancudomyces culisetae]|eukprot:OMH81824.1 RNA polymerase II transcription factor B subunit 3 [Zancudomyces culisetae]